jgi:hypothetical protein
MVRTRSPRLFVWLALCLAVLTFARALVPAGFMPTSGVDQQIRMVMCTGFGPASSDDTGAPADHQKNPCLYAATTPLADPAPDVVVAAPAPYAVALSYGWAYPSAQPDHKGHGYGARAPPVAV